ncbi:hypothetical protein BD414DRAFT_500477 [Trametes punicea]|nr:hypothetical protein BD414DRAFT_500477 [Trametes punicea]
MGSLANTSQPQTPARSSSAAVPSRTFQPSRRKNTGLQVTQVEDTGFSAYPTLSQGNSSASPSRVSDQEDMGLFGSYLGPLRESPEPEPEEDYLQHDAAPVMQRRRPSSSSAAAASLANSPGTKTAHLQPSPRARNARAGKSTLPGRRLSSASLPGDHKSAGPSRSQTGPAPWANTSQGPARGVQTQSRAAGGGVVRRRSSTARSWSVPPEDERPSKRGRFTSPGG